MKFESLAVGITVGSRRKYLEEKVCDKKRRIENDDNEDENNYDNNTTVTKSKIVSFLLTWLIARAFFNAGQTSRFTESLRNSNQNITLAAIYIACIACYYPDNCVKKFRTICL